MGWQVVFLRPLGEKKEQNRRRTKFRVENEMSDFTFVSWQLSLEAVPWFMVIDDDASRGT